MTPMMQARLGIARWRLRIASIEIKSAARALFGPHPWKESNSTGDKIVGNRVMREDRAALASLGLTTVDVERAERRRRGLLD